uniref:hypothetical protein n=1 Tax=Drosera capensis TaxID=4366 RepID=UPI0024111212|nr:hypothetical protein P8577_pgp034 [Drosera capensis]WEQ03489.1 hypothetical protein [Drosera capensis]
MQIFRGTIESNAPFSNKYSVSCEPSGTVVCNVSSMTLLPVVIRRIKGLQSTELSIHIWCNLPRRTYGLPSQIDKKGKIFDLHGPPLQNNEFVSRK